MPKKPTGRTGPLKVGPQKVTRALVRFPNKKSELELMIARIFVDHPCKTDSLSPFSGLKQNAEDDLDFSIETSEGRKWLELAEFAPLNEINASYASAPKQLSMAEYAKLYYQLIARKSRHQGGVNRLLLTYATHGSFFVSPPVQELVRRWLCREHPRFDRVYFLSPHCETTGTTFEVFPGRPHSMFKDMSDLQLSNLNLKVVDLDELAANGMTVRLGQ
ncbi:MAG: hypothetical protein WAW96_02080 [Alphaproteobacteria bacterium]